jgi:ribosomal protein S6--L-glutamate ligase
VVQPFLRGDGWDTKLWAIGDELFAARRRSSLAPVSKRRDVPIALRDLPPGTVELARDVGAAFDLQLFGVDVIVTPTGPCAVDVNPFPGYRGAPNGAEALASFIDGLARGAKAAA